MRYFAVNNVIIIGGGAAGMMAGIIAARQGSKVTIIEQQWKLGRKILSTGNGRCNFTNEVQEPSCYRSSNCDFPFIVYGKFPYEKTLDFFKKLGIYPKNRNGYIYPNSNQASAVVETMVMELRRLNVEILVNTRCERIVPNATFSVYVSSRNEKGAKIKDFSLQSDKVILATGSKATPKLGADGSGYTLGASLGHQMIPVLPALVQLKCEESFYKHLAGIRIDGRVSIYVNGQERAYDTGEIQLTNYGLSGIPVFQVSGFVAKELATGNEVMGQLNFMPHLTFKEVEALLYQRIQSNPDKGVGEFLIGLFPKKLSDTIIKLCGLNPNHRISYMIANDPTGVNKLAKKIVDFKTKIVGTNSFDHAQVCQGGVDTKEINPDTMESLLIPGLYFAGEVLDVDGICGGYNLQWAWSSGAVAGGQN